MTYYRIAGRLRAALNWSWRTSRLETVQAVWAHTQRYRWASHTEFRVFFASSVDGLEEMLARANEGKASTSFAAEHVVPGQLLPTWEWEETERGNEPKNPVQEQAPRAVMDASPQARNMYLDPLDLQRLEMELGAGGDHDTPYRFAWPAYWPEVLAWIRLRARMKPGDEAVEMELHSSQGQKLSG